MSGTENVIKVTLGTGKVVLFREFKIRHKDLAVKACAKEANGDALVLSSLVQSELIRILVRQVDGRDLKAVDTQDLDKLFDIGEYAQLGMVIQEMTGDVGNSTKPVIEVMRSGDNLPGSQDTHA